MPAALSVEWAPMAELEAAPSVYCFLLVPLSQSRHLEVSPYSFYDVDKNLLYQQFFRIFHTFFQSFDYHILTRVTYTTYFYLYTNFVYEL